MVYMVYKEWKGKLMGDVRKEDEDKDKEEREKEMRNMKILKRRNQ